MINGSQMHNHAPSSREGGKATQVNGTYNCYTQWSESDLAAFGLTPMPINVVRARAAEVTTDSGAMGSNLNMESALPCVLYEYFRLYKVTPI